MTSALSHPPIYPDYCHALSPTIGKWCPLRARDVAGLTSVGMYHNSKEIFYYGNHPIKWVRVTGVLVAVDEFTARKVYTIDDSSGMCVECTCPLPPTAGSTASKSTTDKKAQRDVKPEKPTGPSPMNPSIPFDDLEVGTVVKIKGKLSDFRGQKQVEIIKAEVMRGTETEIRCWDEVLEFRKEILSVPWVVSAEEEEKFKKKATKEKQYARSRKEDKGKGSSKEGQRIKEKSGADTKRRRTDGASSKPESRHKSEERVKKAEKSKVKYPSLEERRQLAMAQKGRFDLLGL